MGDEDSLSERIILRLLEANKWYLVLTGIISAEVVTALCVLIISTLFYPEMQGTLLRIGVFVSFAASLIAGGGLVYLLTEIKDTRTSNVELKEANRLKDLFTDIMGHDLINPVGIIRNYAELLEGEEAPVDKVKIQGIIRNARKLEDIIFNVSQYGKLESGEALEFSEVDLSKTLEELLEDFKDPAKDKKIDVSFTADAGHMIKANPALDLVFTNLLSNAIKYGPDGTSVKIAIDDEGKNKIVSFTDEGNGIPDADKEEIFERFTRRDKGSVKGTGLGLAITKRIVEIHNGRVWVEDNPEGKGSVFFVSLPK